MIYLKWKLSDGVSGTGPEPVLDTPRVSAYVDAAGYRIGYAGDAPTLTGGVWDITELSQAEALTFAQTIWPDAAVAGDGTLTEPSPPEPPTPPE